jgi:hypothetical protein
MVHKVIFLVKKFRTISLCPVFIVWYGQKFGIFAVIGLSGLIGGLTSLLYVKTSSSFEKWLRIDTLGDLSVSDLTREAKKADHELKLENKRKARQEEKRKQRKTDFKMGTQEFKEDALPSKKELQRVDSPFDFNFDSPENEEKNIDGSKKSKFEFVIGRLPNEMNLSEE